MIGDTVPVVVEKLTRGNGNMTRKVIVVLNGLPRSGKDSFADAAVTYVNSVYRKRAIKLSSVDKIKEAASLIGWEGEKDSNSREFLAELKYLSSKHFDHSFNYITSEIQKFLPDLAFVMIREPDEIQRLMDHYKGTDYEVKVVLVRGNFEKEYDNIADSSISGYNNYDVVLYNHGTLADWQKIARNFIDNTLEEEKQTFLKEEKQTFWQWLCSWDTLGDLE